MKSRLFIATSICLMFLSTSVLAERIRLDRKSGVVNKALQEMLSDSISQLANGVGKIEFNEDSEASGDCQADLFVSPETVYAVIDFRGGREHSEFYVDHPHDSFKDILFQALVKQGERTELSVDKKSSGYKFITKGRTLEIIVKQKGEELECKFDLGKAVLHAGSTE